MPTNRASFFVDIAAVEEGIFFINKNAHNLYSYFPTTV